MTDALGTIRLQPPTGFRLKDVKLDLKKLFVKAGEAVVQAGAALALGQAGTVRGAISAVFGTADAVTVTTPIEVVAWHLVRGAIGRAVAALVEEWLPNREPDEIDLDAFGRQFAVTLTEADVTIGRDFFRNPSALPLLPPLRRLFTEWLELCGVAAPEAASRSGRFDSYFSLALHDEWRATPDKYQRLLGALDSPFAGAARLDQDWERHRRALGNLVDQPVFEESFGLRQIYVKLRATWTRKPKREAGRGRREIDPPEPAMDDRQDRFVVVDLHEEVADWLGRARTAAEAILLLSGGPGSGKSSFAKMLAKDLAEDPARWMALRVLFVPLQRFNLRGRLDEAIGEYAKDYEGFSDNPVTLTGFAAPQRRLLLIFDGLDELTKPGDLADEETRRFITELRTTLDRWNDPVCRVLALVTGRTAAVQTHRDALRLPERQQLSVLRYLVRIPQYERDQYDDPAKRLEADQRLDWWRNYARCKANIPAEMPAELKISDLEDLTAEPLLNYLLALSGYHEDPQAVGTVNRNAIYAKLFADVANRRHGHAPLAARTEQKDRFDRMMEAIAVAAWHGDGRTASFDEVRACCPAALKDEIDTMKQKGGFHRLIAAFYIQEFEGAQHRNAIEFTHKSFGEYLTARRLVREIAEIDENLRPGRRYSDDDALKDWFALCKDRPLTFDLLRFLRDEVAMPEWRDRAAAWQEMLCRLFSRQLRDGMPASPSSTLTFRQAETQARNAEETLFAALNACARRANAASPIDWRDEYGAVSFLARCRYAGFGYYIAIECLSYCDFSFQFIDRQDLQGGEFAKSQFREAYLNDSYFSDSDFTEACLTEAQLPDSILTNAILNHARLDEANLRGADLSNADLSEAQLQDANLSETNLPNSTIIGANLKNAILSEANLYGANLTNAHLEDAILIGADLRGANLTNTVLSGADLTDADLRGATIKGTSFLRTITARAKGLPQSRLT